MAKTPENKLAGWLALFAIVLAITACTANKTSANEGAGSKPSPKGTTIQGALVSDGHQRTYHLYLPGSLDSHKPAPIVLVFHGAHYSSPEPTINAAAETAGFIVVYADTIGGHLVVNGEDVSNEWNAGICCGQSVPVGIDDVGFVNRLLDDLFRAYRIDPSRVYAMGLRNGGGMALRLGCELASRVAAIGAVAGPFMPAQCHPSRPVALAQALGTDDVIVGTDEVAATMERWRQLDRCSGPVTSDRNGYVTRIASAGCTGGVEVTTYLIQNSGNGNPWPIRSYFNVATVMWDFFNKHPKNP
jgi:polyhydroxybutyrate depolymerase